jgi:hypothetical protein
LVGNGASELRKLAKKAFPLDRAMVIAILLRPADPAPVVTQALGTTRQSITGLDQYQASPVLISVR